MSIIHSHLAHRCSEFDAIGREAALVLVLALVLGLVADVTMSDGPIEPTGHPATRHLATALASATDIATALRPIATAVPWRYSYAPRTDAPDLGQDIAFAELVGPAAPFRHAAMCLGFLLIGPHRLYPPRAHPAVELYYVVSGTATWTAGQASWWVPPGSYILHPSDMPHATRTNAEPLLAVYMDGRGVGGLDVHVTALGSFRNGVQGRALALLFLTALRTTACSGSARQI